MAETQLTFDWASKAPLVERGTAIERSRVGSGKELPPAQGNPATAALAPTAMPSGNAPLNVAVGVRPVESPWDFRSTFPSPRPDALEAGVLAPEDADDDGLRSIHEEHARQCVALLCDLDAVETATRAGIDPRTNKSPRTEKQRARLQEFLRQEPVRLKRELVEAMDAYANAFGDVAADAFRAFIASCPRTGAAEATPCPTSTSECPEADAATVSKPHQYGPGHPWHYLAEGDGAAPPAVEEIEAAPFKPEHLGVKLPKNPQKRQAMLRKMLADQRRQLEQDTERYQDVLERGVEALSRYDREIAYGGNDHLAVASTIAFKHSHIAYAKARVAWLESQTGLSASGVPPTKT
ncbi:MAG: hypothetical protein K8S99_07035 [Planctomycetes bacterium]|nr:hypothetical protein [Planctomycetota bacterium]